MGNLALSDDQAFRVSSVLNPSVSAQVVDWYGSATVAADGAGALTFMYEGSWSGLVKQKLWVRNFATGQWEEVSSSQVSEADVVFTWLTTNPAAYVSAQGQVRMRVGAIVTDPVTCRGDAMSFTVHY
jgi:hypothetical protein